jgi:hypothetical protein
MGLSTVIILTFFVTYRHDIEDLVPTLKFDFSPSLVYKA